jgi:hypothetical protein
MDILRGPELAYGAQRRERLSRFVTGAFADPADAEQWISAWEEHALRVGVRRDSAAFWNAGLRWIAAQREAERNSSEEAA